MRLRSEIMARLMAEREIRRLQAESATSSQQHSGRGTSALGSVASNSNKLDEWGGSSAQAKSVNGPNAAATTSWRGRTPERMSAVPTPNERKAKLEPRARPSSAPRLRSTPVRRQIDVEKSPHATEDPTRSLRRSLRHVQPIGVGTRVWVQSARAHASFQQVGTR